ncbi:MAG TPA: hypothetical protein VNC79_01815 [Mycobacteriales bacterium]|nr:hypothetical protein [Mycobacteriales bacterium]
MAGRPPAGTGPAGGTADDAVRAVGADDEETRAARAVSAGALVGRREQALLDEPSVLAAALLLARRCRDPEPWVRAAVGTLDRFRREVADGDLPGLLAVGRADPAAAERSLRAVARRHDGLTGGQLASLAFGPKLWWTAAGVPVPWRPLWTAPASRPLPGRWPDADVRLLLLALIGTGATEPELLAVRVGDTGRLDAAGRIVPDPDAEPLALAYRAEDGGAEHVTFLSYEARAVLHDRLADRGPLGFDDPLLLPADRAAAAAAGARSAAAALIVAGNDVNVAMCRTTGDFFRAWGMPGARFDSRTAEEHP